MNIGAISQVFLQQAMGVYQQNLYSNATTTNTTNTTNTNNTLISQFNNLSTQEKSEFLQFLNQLQEQQKRVKSTSDVKTLLNSITGSSNNAMEAKVAFEDAINSMDESDMQSLMNIINNMDDETIKELQQKLATADPEEIKEIINGLIGKSVEDDDSTNSEVSKSVFYGESESTDDSDEDDVSVWTD